MISNTVVEGSMTRARFLHYLEFTVVYLRHVVASLHLPFTSRCRYVLHFPGYLSVLVMDNARIHHGDQILELAD
jgi:hypothetical protein